MKLSVLPKFMYWFNPIPIKISAKFSVEIDHLIQKCIWKEIGPRIAKVIMIRNKVGEPLYPMVGLATQSNQDSVALAEG